jgi:hypothetical protein
MTEFCYGSALMIGLVMLALIWGMPEHINRGQRPPSHPPGWKNTGRFAKEAARRYRLQHERKQTKKRKAA